MNKITPSYLFFALLIFALAIAIANKINDESINDSSNTHKENVIEENKNPQKKIGEAESELLNENHLYENYTAHYTIMFPLDYLLDYGIGKYSSIRAYDPVKGAYIAVNTKPSDMRKYFPDERLKDKIIEDTLTKSFYHDLPKHKESLELVMAERGLIDAKMVNFNLTRFGSRIFVKMEFHGFAVVDNAKYELIVIDYFTQAIDFNYHFSFHNYRHNCDLKWDTLIQLTMGSVHINQNIN